jgi:5-phospho-D-xylono-1,4-lactonase
MKKIIRTVRGDIDPESTGFNLPHEHLITFPPMRVRTDIDFRLQSIEKAIEEVNYFKAAGGTILADLTTNGYGRNVKGLKRISEETGVHVLSTTGFIMESLFPNIVFNSTESELVDLLTKDITEGMDGTDIKAGWVKCGTSSEAMTRAEEKVIRAAAKTHHRTGVSVTTHTTNGSMAFNQINALFSENVPPDRISIGHVDRHSLQFGFIRMIAKTGVYFAFDNIGKTKYYPDSLRIDIIKQLIDEGHVKQILLSDDNGRQSYFRAYGGGPGMDYIPTVFVKMMLDAGISTENISQMTIINPRNFMAFNPK